MKIGNVNITLLKKGHNNAGKNERAIEVPLGVAFAKAHKRMLEIGAVLPYYSEVYDGTHKVVDEADPKGTVKVDVMTYKNFEGAAILAISTLEHMGTGKYGGKIDKFMPKHFLQRVLDEAGEYLITAPIGQYEYCDSLIKTWDEMGKIPVTYLKKVSNTRWKVVTPEEAWQAQYDEPFKWANAIAVISNWPELVTEQKAPDPEPESAEEELEPEPVEESVEPEPEPVEESVVVEEEPNLEKLYLEGLGISEEE